MIASAMQIMNMIASAMWSRSLKAAIDFGDHCAENAENATVCVICVSVPCVSRVPPRVFCMRFLSSVKV